MQHLLARDSEEHSTPPFDDLKLILAETAICCVLQAERGIEVLAHHGVLKLGSLTQKISQLLAILHNDGRLIRHGKRLSAAVCAANVDEIEKVVGARGCCGDAHRCPWVMMRLVSEPVARET